jgi:hypothetical protein
MIALRYLRHNCDISTISMATFYDNIKDFFDTDASIKNIIKEPNIFSLHSKIIKDYMDKMTGSDEYFEDKVLTSLDTFVNRCENADDYDEACNNIIFIYYKSIKDLNKYYSDIYKKDRFYLDNLP